MPPDVWVENSPADEARGLDRELKAAIDEAMKMLKAAKPKAANHDPRGMSARASSFRCRGRYGNAASVAFLAFVIGCSGGGATQPTDNSVARIDVAPPAPLSLASGSTASLSATAFTKDNRSLGASAVSWSSTNQGVATVAGGIVTAVLVGTTTITASSGGVSSAGVIVTVSPGAASQLVLRTQPDGAASAAPLAVQPVVEIRDAAGNVVTSSALAVTVTLASGGGLLTGTGVATAALGVATFTVLTVTGIVGPRTLAFTAPGVAPATSATFALAAGAPTQLAVRTQPVAGTAYAAFSSPAAVEIRDAAGNVASSTAAVTAAIASGGGALGGAATVVAVAGVATFTTLTINGTAGARSLTFTSGALLAVTSASFNVAAAPPAIIAISPSTATISASFGSNPAGVNLAITNTGVFPLTNLRVQNVLYNPVAPGGWLAATFPSGTDAPATLRLTATSASIPLGTYTASVVVAGDGAAATTSLTVTLVVSPVTVNTYGTPANKVSIVNIGSTIAPAVVTTTSGAVTATDPTIAFISRSPATATVDATGRITAAAIGQVWVAATSTQSNSDSVLVIVPRSTGLILRTDLTNYGYHVGDTVTVHVQVDTRGTPLGAATLTFTWPVYIGSGVFGALQFIDVNTTASPLAPLTTVDQAVNVMRITGASVAGATGVVELATVRFRVVRSGINALFVNAIELLGTDLSNLLPTATFTQYPVIVP